MIRTKELDLIGNKKLVILLNIASFVILIPSVIIFFYVTTLLGVEDKLIFESGSFLIGMLLLFSIVIIHELIHGLFFKLFNPKGKVKFGFKQGMAYATSPQSIYSKKQFYIISLMPLLLITTGLLAGFLLHLISPFFFVMLASLHTSACIGDLYVTVYLAREDRGIYVEDTERGFNLYRKEVDDEEIINSN